MPYIVLDDIVLAGSESFRVMGGLGGILNKFNILLDVELPQPFEEKTFIDKAPNPIGTFRKLIVISFKILETVFTDVVTPATDTLAVEFEIPSVDMTLTPSGRIHL
jgi:hypothetical protein